MGVEIYLDTLFLMNLMIHLWILSLLRKRFGISSSRWRDWAAAFTGTAVYIGVLGTAAYIGALGMTVIAEIFLQLFTMILSVGSMTVVFLPGRKRYLWKKVIAHGFFYSFVIAGILRAVLRKWAFVTGREITVWTILLSVYACAQIGSLLLRKGKELRGKSICPAIIHSSGVKTGVMALIDTGNSLLEPVSGKPVCLIEEELLARITLENTLFYRAIPFRSVGCEYGILYGVEIPELTVCREEKQYVIHQVICAGVPYSLSKKGSYQMILHPAILQEE